jgi:hypothetical protein
LTCSDRTTISPPAMQSPAALCTGTVRLWPPGACSGRERMRPRVSAQLPSRLRRAGDWHRAAHVWVFCPSTRELLLQQRALGKDSWPGLWDISAAGHGARCPLPPCLPSSKWLKASIKGRTAGGIAEVMLQCPPRCALKHAVAYACNVPSPASSVKAVWRAPRSDRRKRRACDSAARARRGAGPGPASGSAPPPGTLFRRRVTAAFA